MDLGTHDLIRSFGIQTNWYVITGASSSGKTTLINQIDTQGFKVVPEVGRQYFERELATGRTIDDIRNNPITMTREIHKLTLELAAERKTTDNVFFDRGIPDSLAFYRFVGMNPDQILQDCFQYCYTSIFILDRLPYQQDEIRKGDDKTATYFDKWLEHDYSALGYKVIRVPVTPPEERLAFILNRISV